MEPTTIHYPVLYREVLEAFDPKPGQIFVDGTLGGGGHTRRIAEKVGPDGLVIGMDRDPVAVERTNKSLEGLPVKTVAANYADLPEILEHLEIEAVDGILVDLGLSTDQLADHDRGFSYHAEGPLDLRFNQEVGRPAWQILQRMNEKHLADLIYKYGEERFSRRIARKIVDVRQKTPIKTAQQLADLVRRCVPRSKGHSIDPATRTFQALRIAVNEELKWLEVALRRFPQWLKPDGQLLAISFHSLEDRIVKNAFREHPLLDVVTKKPIRPTEEENQENPASTSSRMRIAKRNQVDPEEMNNQPVFHSNF